MSPRLEAYIRAHPVGAFCIWFFPVAWAIALLPLVVHRPFGVELPLEVFLSAATLIGGLLPVVIITRIVDGPAGLDTLRRRLLPPGRAAIGWYALALVPVPILSLLLGIGFNGAPTGTLTSAVIEGLLLQGILGFLFVNLWEEATWMGFVQARLQAHGAMLAAIVTAALFALQHVPLVVEGGLTNPTGFVLLLLLFLLSIPFRALNGWVYNRTGSVFLVGLLHAFGDASTNGSFAGGFLQRLYPNADVGFFHILALAAIGLVVIIATRGRLGLPARSALVGQTRVATVSGFVSGC